MLSLAGCTLLTSGGSTQQCKTDDDCRSRFAGRDDLRCNVSQKFCEVYDKNAVDWSCIGTEPKAAPQLIGRSIVHIKNESSTAPLPGAVVKMCTTLDVPCSAPLDVQTADENGDVWFNFPAATSIYLSIEGNGSYLPTLVYGVTLPDPSFAVPSVQAFNFISSSSGFTVAAGTGHLFLIAFDCSPSVGMFGGGVRFSIDRSGPSDTPVYSRGGIPSPSVSETEGALGSYGAIINLAPGTVTARGSVVVKDSPLRPEQTLQIRAGWVTYVLLAPDPNNR